MIVTFSRCYNRHIKHVEEQQRDFSVSFSLSAPDSKEMHQLKQTLPYKEADFMTF